MQPMFKALIAASCGVGAMLAAATAEAQQAVRIRASGSFPAQHTTAIATDIFKSEVARLSKNTIQVDNFPGNQLGGGFEQVDQLRTGQIQMAYGGLSFYDRLVPEFGAATLPFIAASGHQAMCMIDSEFGAYLASKAEEKGIVLLGMGYIGARHVTNNRRPIKAVEDLKGLKIRTPSGEAWTLTFRAVGANPVPIDIAELYQALQQNVVDGQENPYDNMWVRKFHEVQKHLSNTGHFHDWSGYMMHKPTFDKLTADQQKAVRDAMFTAIAAQRAMSERDQASSRASLIKGGMTYTELSAAELAKFREATRSVYVELRKKIGDKVMDMAEKAAKDCS